MKILIRNPNSKRETTYTAAELKREALAAVKGRGALVGFLVSFEEFGRAVLVAEYRAADGATGRHFVAI